MSAERQGKMKKSAITLKKKKSVSKKVILKLALNWRYMKWRYMIYLTENFFNYHKDVQGS